MSSNRDQARTCVDCSREFVWAAGEQEFFHRQGFADPPKRCKDCRRARKARQEDDGRREGR